jgi:hypothetical protein
MAELAIAERTYQVRGLSNNTSFDTLKVNLRLIRHDAMHVDTLDLYQARARSSFAAVAAQITGLEKTLLESDLSTLLVRLEERQQPHPAAELHSLQQAQYHFPADRRLFPARADGTQHGH